MTRKTIAILGAGFGGLVAANELRSRLSSDDRIILVERKRSFSMGLSNLWIMTGERRHPSEGEHDLASIKMKGIEYRNDDVLSINPAEKYVKTSTTSLNADYLIIALGAELAPQEINDFSVAYNFYDAYEAHKLQIALQQFTSGTIVILITRTPFKCPAAPYEAAFLIDALLRKRGIRGRVELKLFTPEPHPMPVAGPSVGDALIKMLKERHIDYFPEHNVLKIDAASKRILFEVDETEFDLLLGVPPHVAPSVVREAGLTGPTGWISVDPRTLQTRFTGVYAIGDVAAIKLANGMFLPKAGIFAENEARIVAENICSDIKGEKGFSAFTGEGYCYVEVGEGMAAYGIGNFYASPAPSVNLEYPSTQYRREKEEFERSRVSRWF
jgi:sulfide:quinone oxidoreductase